MKAIELFAGIGGFRLGLERAGIKVVWANEFDKYAAETYDKNFGTNIRGISGQTTERNGTSGTPKQSSQTASKSLERQGNSPDSIGSGKPRKIQRNAEQPSAEYNRIDRRDITTVPLSDVPDHDLLTGGFPCQAFSIAGKRKGFLDETRGTLFFEIARILADKRPRHLLLENVKGLLTHDSGKTFHEILRVLAGLGYRVEWLVLNSKNYGVPQNRERIYIVGHLAGECRGQVFPLSGDDAQDSRRSQTEVSGTIDTGYAKNHRQSGATYINVVGELDNETWSKRHESIRRVHGIDGISPTIPTGTGGGVMTKILSPHAKYGDGDREVEYVEQDISPTIRATHHKAGDNQPIVSIAMRTRNYRGENTRLEARHDEVSNTLSSATKDYMATDGFRIRRLTPIECERLQGFPDNWTEGVSDTQRYKQCGNAVTVNVVEVVAQKLVDTCEI